MKNVPASLAATLRNTDALILAGCFTFALKNGTAARYTDQQSDLTIQNITSGSTTYLGGGSGAGNIGIAGLKLSQKIGVDADSQSVSISWRPIGDPYGPSTIGGQPWVTAVQLGLFDDCALTWGVAALADYGATPIGWGGICPDGTKFGGICTLFKGRVADIQQLGSVGATFTVKSDLIALEQQMPHRFYQPGCNHTLYDGGCKLLRANFTSPGVVSGGSTVSRIAWSGASTSYTKGRIKFLTGRLAGVIASIGAADAGYLALTYPLQFAPQPGDTFEASFGCDKTMATCTARFDNIVNFLGFPFVPQPEAAI